MEYIEREDLEVYVANHPFVLVHWYSSVGSLGTHKQF